MYSQAQLGSGQGSLNSKTFQQNSQKFTKVQAPLASESLVKEYDTTAGKTNQIPLKERARETPARQRAVAEGEAKHNNSEHETRAPVTQGTPGTGTLHQQRKSRSHRPSSPQKDKEQSLR